MILRRNHLQDHKDRAEARHSNHHRLKRRRQGLAPCGIRRRGHPKRTATSATQLLERSLHRRHCNSLQRAEAKTNFPIWEKQKQFSDDDEDDKAELSDTKGKSKSNKKAKAEPTKQDMHAVVVDILKEVYFNTISNASLAVHGEKNELRDENNRLKEEKEKLEQQVKVANIQPNFS
ncbi:hypothetical protein JHK85_010528 [Glycine max]|nr:hypothetical protein JHK85_010528 [Glycine max]